MSNKANLSRVKLPNYITLVSGRKLDASHYHHTCGFLGIVCSTTPVSFDGVSELDSIKRGMVIGFQLVKPTAPRPLFLLLAPCLDEGLASTWLLTQWTTTNKAPLMYSNQSLVCDKTLPVVCL